MTETTLATCPRETEIAATFTVRITAKMRDFGKGGMGSMLKDLDIRITDTLLHEMEWKPDSIEPSDALREVLAVQVLDISNEEETGEARQLTPEEVEEIDFDVVE